MKIGLAQIEVKPLEIRKNVEKILEYIEGAKNEKLDVVVFPEMVVGGYLIGDEWENADYINELIMANEEIRNHSEGITVIWGNVDVDKDKKNEDGRLRKYNAAFVARDGQWIVGGIGSGRTYKTLLPKYREFDDERHFYSLQKYAIEENKSLKNVLMPVETNIGKLGVMMCEDMWSDDYGVNPTDILVNNGAEVIINLSCSPWTINKNNKRHRVVKERLTKSKVPFLYCNNVGIQNNGKNIFVFDGGSTAYNVKGEVVCELDAYEEGILIYDSLQQQVARPVKNDDTTKELWEGIVYGLRKFFEKMPSKKTVIGLSGGIDSSLVACLLVKVLGKENVTGINMPSKFNSDLTKGAAAALARNLGIDYKVIPIQESVNLTISQLEEAGFELSELAKENIQARDRGSRILAGVAGAVGAVFTNNGNKTETALGYCTLYGDVNGAIAPIADLYKGQVYELAKYANTVMGDVIPKEILDVVPSAELSDKQDVTKDMGDPMVYPYHDKLLRAFAEWRTGKETLIELYKSGKISEYLQLEKPIENYFADEKSFVEDIEDKWRKYKLAVFKRVQAPPIVVMSRRAFGFDLRETI